MLTFLSALRKQEHRGRRLRGPHSDGPANINRQADFRTSCTSRVRKSSRWGLCENGQDASSTCRRSWRACLDQWQREAKHRSALAIFGPDAAPVAFDDRACDRQAEPGALFFCGDKRIKYVRQVFLA